MHAFREHGRAVPRILYWFRTPPNVRVGRTALDEDAIRLIEETNPDLTFDWTRMVNAAPGPESAPPRPRDRRRQAGPSAAPPKPAPPAASGPPVIPADVPSPPPVELASESMGEEDDEPAPTLPPAAAQHVEERLGHEGLSRLRARYAELMARIAQRVSDPVRLDELRTQAERLNPDTWVTDEEARRGIETFEAEWEALRARLGGRRRRRRRGGARHRARFGAPEAGAPPPDATGSSDPDDGEPAV